MNCLFYNFESQISLFKFFFRKINSSEFPTFEFVNHATDLKTSFIFNRHAASDSMVFALLDICLR